MATIHRAEIIGSLLRPSYLKEARRAWEAGQLATLEFKRSEDRAVDAAIALQEEAGDIIAKRKAWLLKETTNTQWHRRNRQEQHLEKNWSGDLMARRSAS